MVRLWECVRPSKVHELEREIGTRFKSPTGDHFMSILTWAETLGLKECPYIRRWVLDFKLFSIRIHHWISSDDPRHFHDHPWHYVSLVIKGSYIDVSEKGEMYRPRWSIQHYPPLHRHSVKIQPTGCWTIVFTGPEVRQWGFWVNGKFLKRNRYFFDYRPHPCDKI